MTLFDVPVGNRARIRCVNARPDISRRLRELGLCEEATVSCLMKGHGSVICGIRNVRIGLDQQLAQSIQVAGEEVLGRHA